VLISFCAAVIYQIQRFEPTLTAAALPDAADSSEYAQLNHLEHGIPSKFYGSFR
jgi:hypothetical protein